MGGLGNTQCMVTLLVILGAAAMASAAYAAAAAKMVENPGESQGCRQQIEEQRLRSCSRYLRDSSRYVSEESRWREEFPRCCEELEQVSEQCRCEAIEQVMKRQRGRIGETRGREMRELLETARSLPSLCRISPNYCENIQAASPLF